MKKLQPIDMFLLVGIIMLGLECSVFIVSKTAVLSNFQSNKIIDCWYGDQPETPNVKFIRSYATQGRYCLVVPPDNFNFRKTR